MCTSIINKYNSTNCASQSSLSLPKLILLSLKGFIKHLMALDCWQFQYFPDSVIK